MAINHIPRLLRLARRTGDRLIVTDEAGGGEPMVILPLEEYEALIDQAFGPGEGVFEGGGIDLPVYGEGRNRLAPAVEEEAEAMIELSDEVVSEIAEEAADEADIDEEALKSLWQAPEESKEEVKNAEMPEEVPKKKSSRGEGGEEEFYLEAID